MSCTDFPSAGLIPNVTTHTVGNITYIWTGIAWESQVNVPAGELAILDLRYTPVFSTVANLAAGTSIDGGVIAFVLGQSLKVIGEYGLAEYYVVVDADTAEFGYIDLGSGLYAKNLLPSSESNNFEVIKNIVSRGGRVVITGDSISYNHQDLDATPRSSAELCNAGMRSWSFMLGDIIHKQDAWFKHSDELEWGVFGEASLALYNGSSSPQIIPFGGRVFSPKMLPSESPSLTVNYRHQGDDNFAYFIIHGDPTGFSTTFDYRVDGGVTSNGTTKLATTGLNSYQGRDIRHIQIAVPNDGKDHLIQFFNFAQAADIPDGSGLVQMPLIGFSSKATDVAFTGVGGFSTQDLLTQWDVRAVNYNPDVLLLLIGANDAGDALSIPAFQANLVDMIEQVRVVKPDCQFVLMSTPGSTPGNINSVNDVDSVKYVNAMKEVCIQQRCSFVNLFEYFRSIDPDVFRFDWVHLNRAGNTMLCSYMAKLMGLNTKVEDTDADFSLINFADYNVKSIKGVTAFNGPNSGASGPRIYTFIGTKQGPIGVVKSVVSTDGITVKVQFRYKLTQLGDIKITPWGFFGAEMLTPVITLNGWGEDYIEFDLVRADGLVKVVDADYQTLASSFNFLVSYSG